MTYSPSDKFTQPSDGFITLTSGPSDEELLEIEARVRQGEDRALVVADIETRIEARNQERRNAIATEAGTGGLV